MFIHATSPIVLCLRSFVFQSFWFNLFLAGLHWCLYLCFRLVCTNCARISGWFFQKVLPEIIQKASFCHKKCLISNRRNFGLLAPKSMRFHSKDRKSNDISLQLQKCFNERFFPSHKTRLKFCTIAWFWQPLRPYQSISVLLSRNTRVSPIVSGPN